MAKRFIFLVVFISLVSAGLAGCSGSGEKEQGISIGAILSLTGAMAHGGLDARKGLEMAVEQINAKGGIKGRPVKLIIENINTDPERTVSGALKLLNEDKVFAILGPDDSTLAFAAREQVAEPNHIVIISVTGSSPKLTQGNPKWFFRGATPAQYQTKSLTKYLAQDKGYKRFAILSDSGIKDQIDAFSKGLTEYGLEPVAVETFKTGETNFNGPLLNIKNKNPDVIMFIGYTTEGAGAITQARNLGIKAQFAGSVGIIYDDFIKTAGGLSEGVLASIGFSAYNDAPQVQEFVAAFGKKFNGEAPNHAAAQAYDQINLVFRAMEERDLSFNPRKIEQDRQAIRDYLEQVNSYKGVTANITYTPEDHTAYRDVNIVQVVGGHWKVIRHSGQ